MRLGHKSLQHVATVVAMLGIVALIMSSLSMPSQGANAWASNTGVNWKRTTSGELDTTSWTNTGATLPAARAYAQLAVVGEYVYLFGGYDGCRKEARLVKGFREHHVGGRGKAQLLLPDFPAFKQRCGAFEIVMHGTQVINIAQRRSSIAPSVTVG